MIPENRIPTHPGAILSQEFLAPLGVTQVAFAAHLRVPVQRINKLVRGKRSITPETAWLLSQALAFEGGKLDSVATKAELATFKEAARAAAGKESRTKP
jgi:addiction module HigA family antidote